MEDQSVSVTYFAEPGPQNTEATLAAALGRAAALGVQHVVVASDTGKTARTALERCGPTHQLVVVTNPAGLAVPVTKLHDYLPRFRDHKQQLIDDGVSTFACSLTEEVVSELEKAGAAVHRIDWQRFARYARVGLRGVDWLGVGVRVGLTIAVWAYLAEAVPADRELVAIAGTGFGGGGADTAIVVRTAEKWLDWRVLETIVRPRVSPPTELPG